MHSLGCMNMDILPRRYRLICRLGSIHSYSWHSLANDLVYEVRTPYTWANKRDVEIKRRHALTGSTINTNVCHVFLYRTERIWNICALDPRTRKCVMYTWNMLRHYGARWDCSGRVKLWDYGCAWEGGGEFTIPRHSCIGTNETMPASTRTIKTVAFIYSSWRMLHVSNITWCFHAGLMHVKPFGRYGLGLLASIGFQPSSWCKITPF